MIMTTIEPNALERRQLYALMTTLVAPRPIAFVSTLSPDDVPNLAPFSYFNAGGANPPSVVFCAANRRDGSQKDTVRNIEATGEYTIQIVTYDLAARMNQTSFDYEYGVNEFEKAGLTPIPSVHVRPYRVQESPAQIECKLFDIVRHGEGPLASNYIIGEILCFHISDLLLKEGAPLLDDRVVDFVARMGESWYSRATPESMFQLPKPTVG